MFRKVAAAVLALTMALTSAMPVFARNVPTEARLINIHNTQGDDVTLSRSLGGRSIEPRSGQRLSDGNVLATGWDSFVYMQLDEVSLIKMDESSQVQVNESRNLLTLSLQTGRALVEVTNQPAGHVLETRIGSTVMSVRGTSFIAGRREADYTGAVFVTMLSGYGMLSIVGADGAVIEIYVPAGAIAVTTPDPIPTYTIHHEFVIDEMGLFELEEIHTRSEALIEVGVLTQDMYEQLPAAIERRQDERNARRAQEDARLAQIEQQGGFVAVPAVPEPVTGLPQAALTQGQGRSMVAAGGVHGLAVLPDGILWAWGWNWNGQLGDRSTTVHHSPFRVKEGVVSVSAGDAHSLIIMEDGSLWAWGPNAPGILDDGTNIDRHNPVLIMGGVVSASAGHDHTLAVMEDGSLWTWGPNLAGRLVIGDQLIMESHSPLRVMDGVVSASAGFGHSLAVMEDGSLWVWGRLDIQLGNDGIFANLWSPVRVMEGVVYATAGQDHALAIRADGSLWAWGGNGFGQLGDGTTIDRHSPVRVMDGVVYAAAGFAHSLAIREDGSLWVWGGRNHYGLLGDGTNIDRHSPVRIMDGVVSVSAGQWTSIVVREDGSIWAWGSFMLEQLGDSAIIDYYSPVRVIFPN